MSGANVAVPAPACFFPTMESRYVLRGKILAAQSPAALREEFVDLMTVLDEDAARTASDELAKVRRLYGLEVRKRGREIVWFSEAVLVLPPRVDSTQLLFTLPGVEVFELQPKALVW